MVVLTINPAQLIEQSRDSNRLSDLAVTNSALGIYSAEGGASLGSSSVVYVSIPDPSATSSLGDQCQGLNLPTAPSGTTYFCGASSTYRNVNGSGWLPINFSTLAGGSPLGSLPQDPINQSSSGLYYTYGTNGSQYILTALPESQKEKQALGSIPTPIPDYPDVMAEGSNLSISPLFNASGLVGYWPLDEGTGTTATDISGNGNTGSWNGSLVSGSHYAGGKVGIYAGSFDGSTDYVATGQNNIPTGDAPRSVFTWVYYTGPATGANGYIESYGAVAGTELAALLISGNMDLRFWTGSVGFTSSLALTQNTWYLVGYTFDGSNMILYLNGQSQTNNIGSLTTTSATPVIGGELGATAPFQGQVDDIRIYNRALNASEVTSLYNAEK